MRLPITFQSLKRIQGREGRSKLLAPASDLYGVLAKVKQAIRREYAVAPDRMDLHIEITRNSSDSQFAEKAKSLHGKSVDLRNPDAWVYLGRAFVLSTPRVREYGKTHVTISFFGDHPRPAVAELRSIAMRVIDECKAAGMAE